MGFTIQNSPFDGINVQKSGAATIQNTTVQDAADDGIEATESSTAELIDCTVLRSGDRGINIVRNSFAVMRGANIINESISDGILVFTSSGLSVAAGILQTDMNGRDGILVGGGSALTISSFGAGSITSNNNVRDGIDLFNGGTLNASEGTINATTNGRDGIRVGTASSLFVASPTTLSLSTNSASGLDVRGSSHALAVSSEQGPVSIDGNTGSGVNVNLADAVIIGASVQNNTPDVNLSFGARANFSNTTIAGTITCDGTELVQGAVCSPPQ